MERKNIDKEGGDWETLGGIHFLDILIDSLQQLDQPTQQVFLQTLLKNVHKTPEPDALTHWQEILLRQKLLSNHLGKVVNLKTAAVEYFVTTSLLRQAVLMKHRELKDRHHTVDTDPLTGLYNRRLFDVFFAKELGRSIRHGYALSLVLFNVFNLESAKGVHGQAVADALLVSLACACAESVRGYDYASRVSDFEFAVLLPQSDGDGARIVAERIVGKFKPDIARLAPNIGLRLQYGVASAPDDGENSTALFDVADRRLYEEDHRKDGNDENL
jgi:diguanylate cyclase (GGDEF)-like protein